MKTILFFNGFTLDETDVNLGFDNVVFFNGYLSDLEIKNITEKYFDQDVLVIGYSFGCYYANKLLSLLDEQNYQALAICGTAKPIDKLCGINPIVVNNMLKNMSEATMTDFYSWINYQKEINLTQSTHELKMICEDYHPVENNFNYAIIASNDKIFSANKLKKQFDKYIIMEADHYIFKEGENLDKIRKIFQDPKQFFECQ